MRINTDNLFRLICDLELVHNRYIKDIDEAWGEMLKFGNHEGECGFDGECEKCGAKLGRCAKHGEHMALRLNGMTAALNRARQSPNDPTELPPPDSDGGSRKEHPNEL